MIQEKNRKKGAKSKSKPVKIFKDGVELGEYPSCAELERCSEKDFGIKLSDTRILSVCGKEQKQYKGFIFKHV